MANTTSNAVMDKLTKLLADYEKACKEYEVLQEQKRQELNKANYWDWYMRANKPEYPLTGGQSKALRLWIWAETENPLEELVWDEFVWESEYHDFITTLRDAGVKHLVVTNTSTSLMENMHWFKSEGCKLLGLCEVETGQMLWDSKVPEVKMGVRFAL